MKTHVLLCAGFVWLLSILVPGHGRAAGIENVIVRQEGNMVYVYYNVTGQNTERVNIRLVFETREKQTINPVTLTGDHSNISPGNGKVILWNAGIDLNYWTGELKAIVNATAVNTSFPSSAVRYPAMNAGGPGNALLSAICPGLGDVFVNGDDDVLIKPYYITLAFAGSAGLAWYCHSEMKAYYDAYQHSAQQYEMNSNYEQAEYYRKNASLYTALAVSIWTADVIHVFVKGSRNNRNSFAYSIGKGQTTLFCYAGPAGATLRLSF